MFKIYLSGQITGLSHERAKWNFDSAERRLLGCGMHPVNPFKIAPEVEGMSWTDYMAQDLPELLKCQGIYMLQGWGHSRGARIEYAVARELGLSIFFEDANGQLTLETAKKIQEYARQQ